MAKKPKQPKLSHLEHRARAHHLGEAVEHQTRVVGNPKKGYRPTCSCGYVGLRMALQVEATKGAIHHQLLVRGDRELGGGNVKAAAR